MKYYILLNRYCKLLIYEERPKSYDPVQILF